MKLKNPMPCATLIAGVVAGPAFSQGVIDSQALPPTSPPALQSTAQSISTLPVTPDEGPQERALDQSLGLKIAPSPHTDAEIEARINADAAHRRSSPPPPAGPPAPHFRGPQERALDQSMPQQAMPQPAMAQPADARPTSLIPPIPETPNDIESPEVRRLNGGY